MADLSSPRLPLPEPREGPSPFLEGTAIQYAWDSTCLGALKKCPRYYQYSIIEGWRGRGSNVHLEFGIHFTNALEYYDKLRADVDQDGGADHESALQEVIRVLMNETWIEPPVDNTGDYIEPPYRWEHGPHDSKIGNKNFYNLLRSVIWYLDQFETDPAETVIASDGTPLVERSFRMELGWGPEACRTNRVLLDTPLGYTQPYLLCGHLDRVVSFLGGTFVMDHKTTKTTVSDYYFDQYNPHNQMTLYTLAGQVIFGSPIRGVIIDAVQVAVGFSRPARGLTYRTQPQLEEWMADLRYWLDQAEGFATRGHWPMNDAACFNCAFTKICSKDPAVRETFLAASFTKENPWNPLKIRN